MNSRKFIYFGLALVGVFSEAQSHIRSVYLFDPSRG